MTADIAIVGSGPAAYMAAWACAEVGAEYDVLAPIEQFPKSRMPATPGGVFYLHDNPLHDCLPLEPERIRVSWIGAQNEKRAKTAYALKVYGHTDVSVSLHTGWEPAYDAAKIFPFIFDAADMGSRLKSFALGTGSEEADLHSLAQKYVLVFTSAPAALFGDTLRYSTSWAKVSEAPAGEAYMLYNANPGVDWHRASAVFGRFSIEYSAPHAGAHSFAKVVGDGAPYLGRLPQNVIAIGRNARWEKGYLTHQAYTDVAAALDGR